MHVLILTQSFNLIHFRSQVSRLGTESFILMELLLASLLTCEYATGLVEQIYRQHTETPKSELIQIVAESTEKGCFEDAKAD